MARMDEKPRQSEPQSKWPRFSLKALFVLVALVAAYIGGWQHCRIANEIEKLRTENADLRMEMSTMQPDVIAILKRTERELMKNRPAE